jgi:hypothetical protein
LPYFCWQLNAAFRKNCGIGRWAGLPALAAATTAAATSSAAATSTTTAIAATASSATAASASIALRACFVNSNRATVDIGAIEGFDRGPRLVVVAHRHEGESPRPTGVTIRDYGDFFDLTMSPKLCLQRFLGRGKGKVANIQLHRAQLQNREPASTVAGLAEAGTSEIGCTQLPRSF